MQPAPVNKIDGRHWMNDMEDSVYKFRHKTILIRKKDEFGN